MTTIKRTPVLTDHKRVKSKLVTPFNDAFGPMHEVSWINMLIPELLWIALVQQALGPRRGVEIITAFTRDVRASDPKRDRTIWAAAGKFVALPDGVLADIVDGLLSKGSVSHPYGKRPERYGSAPLCGSHGPA